MPKLVRLYLVQSAIGFLLSAIFVAALLWLNVANLWGLVTNNSAGPLAVLLLWLFNGTVFAGVQFAISIMRMSQDRPSGPRGNSRILVAPMQQQPIPVRVEEDARHRRR